MTRCRGSTTGNTPRTAPDEPEPAQKFLYHATGKLYRYLARFAGEDPDKIEQAVHDSLGEVTAGADPVLIGDAIVAGDGDASPVDESYLNELLAPLANADAVGANGFSRPGTLGGWLIQPARRLDLTVRKPLYGRSSAISAAGWEAAGSFRTDDVDQTDVVDVRQEEEFAFRRRLGDVGSVVDVAEARVYNDNRRYNCSLDRGFNRFGRPMTGYCKRIGTEAFHPKPGGRR